MELEDQVCNLELSKRLRELGVKQESLFYWTETISDDWQVLYQSYVTERAGQSIEWYSAFTSAELGKMLPVRVISGRRKAYFMSKPLYFCNFDGRPKHQESAETEADARAKMLVYLIENKLVDPISSNER